MLINLFTGDDYDFEHSLGSWTGTSADLKRRPRSGLHVVNGVALNSLRVIASEPDASEVGYLTKTANSDAFTGSGIRQTSGTFDGWNLLSGDQTLVTRISVPNWRTHQANKFIWLVGRREFFDGANTPQMVFISENTGKFLWQQRETTFKQINGNVDVSTILPVNTPIYLAFEFDMDDGSGNSRVNAYWSDDSVIDASEVSNWQFLDSASYAGIITPNVMPEVEANISSPQGSPTTETSRWGVWFYSGHLVSLSGFASLVGRGVVADQPNLPGITWSSVAWTDPQTGVQWRRWGSGTGATFSGVSISDSLDAQVFSPIFAVEQSEVYRIFTFVYAPGPAQMSVTLEWLDSNESSVGSKEKLINIPRQGWYLASVGETTPLAASRGQMNLEFTDLEPGDEFLISAPCAVKENSGLDNPFLKNTLATLPSFMIEEDKILAGPPRRPLTRYIDSITATAQDIADSVMSWDHVYPSDALDHVDHPSAFALADETEPEVLVWLAQLLGVQLGVMNNSSGTWALFEEAGIDTWVEFEESVDPGGSGPDTEWIDIESYSSGSSDPLAAWRTQVGLAYNGLNAGRKDTLQELGVKIVEGVLNNPFVYVRNHYRASPHMALVAIDHLAESLGVQGAIEVLQTAVAAGTKVFVLIGGAYSAWSFWDALEASNFVTTGWGMYQMQDQAFPDGSGRGINLIATDWVHTSRKILGGIVAEGRFFDGLGFYSGGAAELGTATSSALNLTTSGNQTFEVLSLLSDIQYTGASVGSGTLIHGEDWRVDVNSDSTVTVYYGAGGAASAQSASINFKEPEHHWLRIRWEGSGSNHSVKFYYTHQLYNEWTPLNTVAKSGHGVLGASSESLAFFDYSASMANAASVAPHCSGVLYRGLVLDGPLGAGQWATDTWPDDETGLSLNNAVADINLTSGSDITDLYVGTTGFTEDGSGLAVTLTREQGRLIGCKVSSLAANDAFFHFGESPQSLNDDVGLAGRGDDLSVSLGSSISYDWIITYTDATQDTGSGTGTSITWAADDYGNTSIASIEVLEGATQIALFDPANFDPAASVWVDTHGITWTLTRDWDKAHRYEFSSIVDRECVKMENEAAYAYSDRPFDTSEATTIAGTVRRFWDGSQSGASCNIISQWDTSTLKGIRLWWYEDYVIGEVATTDGRVFLSWNESNAGRIGQWNQIVLRRSIARTVDLVVNGEVVATADAQELGSNLIDSPPATIQVGSNGNVPDFEWSFLGYWDSFVSDQSLHTLTYTGATSAQSAAPSGFSVVQQAFGRWDRKSTPTHSYQLGSTASGDANDPIELDPEVPHIRMTKEGLNKYVTAYSSSLNLVDDQEWIGLIARPAWKPGGTDTPVLCGRYNGASTGPEMRFSNTSGRAQLVFHDGVSDVLHETTDLSLTLSPNVFYYLRASYNATDKDCDWYYSAAASVNPEPTTVSWTSINTSASVNAEIVENSNPFWIGQRYASTAASAAFDGDIGGVWVYNGILGASPTLVTRWLAEEGKAAKPIVDSITSQTWSPTIDGDYGDLTLGMAANLEKSWLCGLNDYLSVDNTGIPDITTAATFFMVYESNSTSGSGYLFSVDGLSIKISSSGLVSATISDGVNSDESQSINIATLRGTRQAVAVVVTETQFGIWHNGSTSIFWVPRTAGTVSIDDDALIFANSAEPASAVNGSIYAILTFNKELTEVELRPLASYYGVSV